MAVSEVRAGNYVLDAHALLAFFQKELGHEIVATLIERTASDVLLYLSLINLGEIAYITERELGSIPAGEIINDIKRPAFDSVRYQRRTRSRGR